MGIFSTTSSADRERYEQLCQVVTLGLTNFRKVGKALTEIRDRELYKLDGLTFDELCRTKWKISAQHAGRLIDAAAMCDRLEPIGSTPTNEHQVRQLRTITNEADQVDAWQEAAAAGGTPEAIAAAVKKRTKKRSRPKIAKPVKLRVPGAWVIIQPNKKYSGPELTLQWAIEQLQKQQAA